MLLAPHDCPEEKEEGEQPERSLAAAIPPSIAGRSDAGGTPAARRVAAVHHCVSTAVGKVDPGSVGISTVGGIHTRSASSKYSVGAGGLTEAVYVSKRSYKAGETVRLAARVQMGGVPVAGAKVVFTALKPNQVNKVILEATTNKDGVQVISICHKRIFASARKGLEEARAEIASDKDIPEDTRKQLLRTLDRQINRWAETEG